MLTTVRGQPAPCRSNRTKGLCHFPEEPRSSVLGSRCPSVLSSRPHHTSPAAVSHCPSESEGCGQKARSSAGNEASFACVGQGARGVEEAALPVTGAGERVSCQRVPRGVRGTAWGRAWVSTLGTFWVRPADPQPGFAVSAALQEGSYPHHRHKPGSRGGRGSLVPSQPSTRVHPASPRSQGAESIAVPALC